MQIGRKAWMMSACMGFVACGQDRDAAASMDDGAQRPLTKTSARAGICVTRDADSDDVVERGRLVQLDITLRYRATRTSRMGAGDSRMELDAQSLVEGTSRQLACAWDLDGGAVRYELERRDGAAPRPFPRTQDGTASLSGTRLTHADGAAMREKVAMSGPLAQLAVVDVGQRDASDADVCVILAFGARLQERSLRHVSASGIQREEPMNPSDLVLDGYSALSPKTQEAGNHRFVDGSFAICTGVESADVGSTASPKRMTISPDGRLWQRSGLWLQHASSPVERRTVDFTMRVVEPTLPIDGT